MEMNECDVVYIVKNGESKSSELIYSLRSVDKNFPRRLLWIFGGKPSRIEPDRFVPIEQTGDTKWNKVTNTLREVCLTPEVSNNFWLFNDDFFVMEPVTKPENYHAHTLEWRINDIETKSHGRTLYTVQLRNIVEILKLSGLKTLNFDVHVPILFNKAKLLEVIDNYPTASMMRSIYGNYWEIDSAQMDADVKIIGRTQTNFEGPYCSTLDASFNNGRIGVLIRNKFSEKSKWEK